MADVDVEDVVEVVCLGRLMLLLARTVVVVYQFEKI